MGLAIEDRPLPLRTDVDGVVRVGGTRVAIDTIVVAFEQGATAEEIVCRYPVLELADVYAVIGYYLRNRSEIESYLGHRKKAAERVRKQNQGRFDLRGVRSRLLSRQSKPEK